MGKVYIVEAKRTAIGSLTGTVKDVHPADLGGHLIKHIVESKNVNPASIDEVIVGNVLPAGLGQGIGRQVAIKGGLPETVPGYSVGMVCGSGMKSVMTAYANIKAGIDNLVFAGGVESMSKAPFLVPGGARSGHKMGDMGVKDHFVTDALTDAYSNIHMGVTAENIVAKYGISREEQDLFAFKSQEKAIKAQEAGKFEEEIVPYVISTRKGDIIFDKDEYINHGTTVEKLSKLQAVFKREAGSVTAGNASGINDGASMILLASEEAVKEYGFKPLAEVVSIGQGGVDPNVMGLGPVPAIRKALKNVNLKLSDMNILELNEAFAAQSLGVIHELTEEHGVEKDWLISRTNINGGAIALGHPVGTSGNRIIVTLLHEMKRENHEYGLASLCIGGGMGTAVILKNIAE